MTPRLCSMLHLLAGVHSLCLHSPAAMGSRRGQKLFLLLLQWNNFCKAGMKKTCIFQKRVLYPAPSLKKRICFWQVSIQFQIGKFLNILVSLLHCFLVFIFCTSIGAYKYIEMQCNSIVIQALNQKCNVTTLNIIYVTLAIGQLLLFCMQNARRSSNKTFQRTKCNLYVR